MAVTAIALFGLAILLSLLKNLVLGKTSDDVQGLGFNAIVFVPINFLALILSIYVICRIIYNWKRWPGGKKLIALCLTLPIVLLWILLIYKMNR